MAPARVVGIDVKLAGLVLLNVAAKLKRLLEGQPQRAGVPFHGRANHDMTTFGFDGLSGTVTSNNR